MLSLPFSGKQAHQKQIRHQHDLSLRQVSRTEFDFLVHKYVQRAVFVNSAHEELQAVLQPQAMRQARWDYERYDAPDGVYEPSIDEAPHSRERVG